MNTLLHQFINHSVAGPNARQVRIVDPYPITHEFKVDKDFEGKTLLDLMATKFPFKPVEEWARRIETGLVYTEFRSGSTEEILTLNQLVYHHNPAVVEPTVPDEVRILEETENYVVVFKPAPMPMHPGGRFNKNTLTYLLEEMGFEGFKIVHRLDSVTSGIVLFAKNKAFAKKAMTAFTEGEVEKA